MATGGKHRATGRRLPAGFVAALIVLTLSAVSAAGSAAQSGPADAGPFDAARVEAAVRDGRVEAYGTWRTADGIAAGAWTLVEGPGLIEAGGSAWRAVLLVAEWSSLERQGLAPRPARLDPGRSRRLVVQGRLDTGLVEFSATDGAEASPQPAFAQQASARLLGTKIEGRFTAADGTLGQWDGWWHLWKRHGATGPTDTVPAEGQ